MIWTSIRHAHEQGPTACPHLTRVQPPAPHPPDISPRRSSPGALVEADAVPPIRADPSRTTMVDCSASDGHAFQAFDEVDRQQAWLCPGQAAVPAVPAASVHTAEGTWDTPAVSLHLGSRSPEAPAPPVPTGGCKATTSRP